MEGTQKKSDKLKALAPALLPTTGMTPAKPVSHLIS